MKRRRPGHLAGAGREALAVHTGWDCPESGWWFPAQRELGEAPSAARYISEGSVMPPNGGNPSYGSLTGRGQPQETLRAGPLAAVRRLRARQKPVQLSDNLQP
jgi:hypothetical protein